MKNDNHGSWNSIICTDISQIKVFLNEQKLNFISYSQKYLNYDAFEMFLCE